MTVGSSPLLCVLNCEHRMLKVTIHEACLASKCQVTTGDRDASQQLLHCCNLTWAGFPSLCDAHASCIPRHVSNLAT